MGEHSHTCWVTDTCMLENGLDNHRSGISIWSYIIKLCLLLHCHASLSETCIHTTLLQPISFTPPNISSSATLRHLCLFKELRAITHCDELLIEVQTYTNVSTGLFSNSLAYLCNQTWTESICSVGGYDLLWPICHKLHIVYIPAHHFPKNNSTF